MIENKEQTEIEQLEEQLRYYKGLDAIKDTDGGKTMLAFHENSIDINLNWLVSNYKDAPDMELRARIAKIEASKEDIDMIMNAKQNAEVIKEQIKSLKE